MPSGSSSRSTLSCASTTHKKKKSTSMQFREHDDSGMAMRPTSVWRPDLAHQFYGSPLPFAAGDHCFHEVLSMLEAGDENADDVEHDKPNRQIGKSFVHLFNPLRSPVCLGRHHVAGDAGASQHCEEGDDRGPARRIVPEIAPRLEQGDITQVGEDFARWPHEAAEPRMTGTDEAPDDTRRNQRRDGVTSG